MLKPFKFLKYLRWPAISVAFVLLLIVLLPLPKPLFQENYSTVLACNEGRLLGATVAKDGQWRFPSIDSIPYKFERCLLLFEDEYFYWHQGVNPVSLFRAIKQNLQAGEIISGGSTISMQVIRLSLGNRSRTVLQKLYETLLSVKLELWYSKEEILTMYVLHAPFGGNVVGLPAASWRYYGRPPDKLSWAECALLAVLPNDPASIFPGKNAQLLKKKRDRLINKLHVKNEIDLSSANLAKAENIPVKPKRLPALAQRLLFRGIQEGFGQTIIHSSLDYDLQKKVKQLVRSHGEKMSGNGVFNAAALVVNIHNGKTLAYVGNTNVESGDHGQQVDIITANRSTGSLLKPILYALAMDDGLLMPEQLIADIPIHYKGFVPQNFDKKFRGAVKINDALAGSRNIPFVFLLKAYGYEKFHQKLKQIGMTSLNYPASHYGLTMILGGAESSLWDMTAMYAGMIRTLNNFDQRDRRYSDLQDYFPNTYQKETKEIRVDGDITSEGLVEAPSVWYMLKAMQQLRRPEELAGWQSFNSSLPIAWKTGTSYGFRDGWAIGMTEDHVVGVWIGNADGEGRPGLTGVKTAAPLMFNIFETIKTETSFHEPAMADYEVCEQSGMLATQYCKDKKLMLLPAYMVSGKDCSYHQNVFLDENEHFRINSSCYSLTKAKEKSWFVLSPIQGWYYKSYHPNYHAPPKYREGCDTETSKKVLEMIYPRLFTKIYLPKEQDGDLGKVVFEAAHEKPGATIFWHLDDQYLGATTNIHQLNAQPAQGRHKLSLIDESGNTIEQSFEVISD